MKVLHVFSIVAGAAFLVSGTVVNAAKIATAPADYLAKTNPYAGDAESVEKAAKKIYKRKCKKCHGKSGDGHGPGAEDMDPMPTAFNAAGYMAGKKDGQLFWIIEKGSKKTEMSAFGPGSETDLSEDDIWKLVTYIRKEYAK